MIKIRLERLKSLIPGRILLWQTGVVAFLLLFIVVFVLNIYLFEATESDILSDSTEETEISGQDHLERRLFDDVVLKIKEREDGFNKALLNWQRVRDPSL